MLRGGPGAPATMTVTLSPTSLGRVRVELTSHDGQLAVRLHAEHQHGVRAIGAGLNALRDALEAEGLHLGDVGVGLTGSHTRPATSTGRARATPTPPPAAASPVPRAGGSRRGAVDEPSSTSSAGRRRPVADGRVDTDL